MKIIKDICLQEALKKIPTFNQAELCEIYSNANSWGWDERLGEMPDEFYKLPEYNWKLLHMFIRRRTRYDYIHPICEAIRAIVGEKELLRYHNVHNLKRTNEEFEQTWNRWQAEKALGIVLYPPVEPNDVCGNDSCSNPKDKTKGAF